MILYFCLQEDYFGVSQKPTEFDAVRECKKPVKVPLSQKEVKAGQDARHFRPMHANITIVLLDIKAELTKV